MTERTHYEPGAFCWVDLTAHDMQAAVRWYGELLGWACEVQDTQGGPPYGMFSKNGLTVAGIGQMSDEMKANGVPPMWNNYVSVEDAAAAEKKVLAAGGAVTVPTMQVSDAGWLAFFTDPQDAAFAVWQAGSHCGSQLVDEAGTSCWNELACKDIDAAKKFYAEVFGWTYSGDQGPEAYAEIKVGDSANGGILGLEAEWGPIPAHWKPYFWVDDADEAVATITRSGGSVLMPAETMDHVGRFAVVQDPQGAVFAVITPASH